jgi:hypothetical protein
MGHNPATWVKMCKVKGYSVDGGTAQRRRQSLGKTFSALKEGGSEIDHVVGRQRPSRTGLLSVVLAGHPKLKNDLRRSSMEEIGSRATIFELEGFGEREAEISQVVAGTIGRAEDED